MQAHGILPKQSEAPLPHGRGPDRSRDREGAVLFRWHAKGDEAAWYGRRFRLPTLGKCRVGRRKRLPHNCRVFNRAVTRADSAVAPGVTATAASAEVRHAVSAQRAAKQTKAPDQITPCALLVRLGSIRKG